MIRKITQEDKAIYIEMARNFYNSEAVDHNVPESNFIITFNEFFKSTNYIEGYIFEYNNISVGYALLSKTFAQEAGGIAIWIDELYILEEYRSKGLGKEFFDFMEKKVIQDNIARVRLEISPSNKRAKKLYENKGFKELDYKQMIKDYL